MKTALFTQDSVCCIDLLSDPPRIKVEDIRYKDLSEKKESVWPRLFFSVWFRGHYLKEKNQARFQDRHM